MLNYTARKAYLGNGYCAFTPGTNITTPKVGACSLCASTKSDSVTCDTRMMFCFLNTSKINETLDSK